MGRTLSDKTVDATATERMGSSRIQKFLRIVVGTPMNCCVFLLHLSAHAHAAVAQTQE
jgi:hypothetical protein